MNNEMNNINEQPVQSVQPNPENTVPTEAVVPATPVEVVPAVETPVMPVEAAPVVEVPVQVETPVVEAQTINTAVEVEPEANTIVQEAPSATDAPLAPEVKPEVVQDADNVTFDYNSLYGIDNTKTEETTVDEGPQLVFQAQDDLNINATTLVGRDSSVTPEFNMNVLTGQETEEKSLTDKVLDAKQQDKADTRKKILFIGIITILIFVFIKFIFPIIV